MCICMCCFGFLFGWLHLDTERHVKKVLAAYACNERRVREISTFTCHTQEHNCMSNQHFLLSCSADI